MGKTCIHLHSPHNSSEPCQHGQIGALADLEYLLSFVCKTRILTFSLIQSILTALIMRMFIIFLVSCFEALPEPDDMKDKMEITKQEIEQKYNFFSQVSKPGAKFFFGEKVCWIRNFSIRVIALPSM